MGDLDIAAKGILKACPVPLLRLLLPRLQVLAAKPDEIELTAQSRRLDKLFSLRIRGRRAPLRAVIEVAARWKSRIPRQVYEYWSPIHLAHGQVEAVALVLKPADRQGRPRGVYAVGPPGARQLEFRFDVVCAWELDAEDLLRRGEPGLLPLLPFTAGATPAHVDAALRQLTRVRPGARRAELQAVLATFASNVFTAVDWLGKIPEEILMEEKNPVLERVRELARADARAERARETLIRYLRSKLPTTAKRLGPRIEKAPPSTLEALCDRVLEAPLDEVEALLERHLSRARAKKATTKTRKKKPAR